MTQENHFALQKSLQNKEMFRKILMELQAKSGKIATNNVAKNPNDGTKMPIFIIVLIALLAGATFAIYYCFFKIKPNNLTFDR